MTNTNNMNNTNNTNIDQSINPGKNQIKDQSSGISIDTGDDIKNDNIAQFPDSLAPSVQIMSVQWENSSNNTLVIDELLHKQEVLMAKVPHPLRQDSYRKMLISKDLFENVLLYLASSGHKPWRPNPLPLNEQQKRLEAVVSSVQGLIKTHMDNMEPSTEKIDSVDTRLLVSTFGIIEESIEFYNTHIDVASVIEDPADFYIDPEPFIAHAKHIKHDQNIRSKTPDNKDLVSIREHQIEELTDEMFFYLEKMVLTGITWPDIIKKYYEKHAINLKRYADLENGNTAWDKRSEGVL